VSLYMPLSSFFNTEMKYLTATPSGENTGTLIAWSILQINHSVHLWVLLLAMCLFFFSISLYYAKKTLFASLEKCWSLMDCVHISFMLLLELAFTQFLL
jgi:type VI protein secretion system component VasF